MNKKNIFILLVCILISFLPGIFGSIFTSEALSTWYPALKKPPLNPPNWVFAPVWTIIYLLIAVSLYFLTKKAGKLSYIKFALFLFIAQLILNGLWSYVFFGLKSLLGSVFAILTLLLTIILCIREFKIISNVASWLMVPYMIWVIFATYLNLALFLLNK